MKRILMLLGLAGIGGASLEAVGYTTVSNKTDTTVFFAWRTGETGKAVYKSSYERLVPGATKSETHTGNVLEVYALKCAPTSCKGEVEPDVRINVNVDNQVISRSKLAEIKQNPTTGEIYVEVTAAKRN